MIATPYEINCVLAVDHIDKTPTKVINITNRSNYGKYKYN